jgi:signal transduction histidine kinase
MAPPSRVPPSRNRPDRPLVGAVRGSRWARVLVLNAGGALLAFGMAIGTDAPGGPHIGRVMVMSLVYTNCVGTFAALTLPPVIRRFGRGSRAADLAVRLAGVVVAIAGGMVLAAAILVGIGVIGPGDFLRHAVPTHWPTYVYPTMLLVSLGISYYLTASDELMDTTIALRTKERDEAIARQQAAEARLAALEARVQPHFLFNALNSIAALIPDDAEGAERMVERVAALMRSSLQQGGPSTAPLAGELRLVCDYLEIERVRFRDRLRYELRIAPGLDHVAVPRLSIQTLVENAIKHVVARQRTGATIVIAASAREDQVLVTVSDDGPGFAAPVEGDGQGLRLLRARLETLFGDRAALRIDSRPGATSCVMEVPIR